MSLCRVLALAAIVLIAACDTASGPVPTAPGGVVIPTIGGTYSSSTMWRFELTSEAGQVETFVCAGSVTIANQLGEAFSGTFVIFDPGCGSISGSVVAGLLGADGSVTFELAVQGTDPNFLTAAFGCTYVSGDRGLRGTLVGTQLQAEARTVMECPQRGRSTFVARAAGAR